MTGSSLSPLKILRLKTLHILPVNRRTYMILLFCQFVIYNVIYSETASGKKEALVCGFEDAGNTGTF